MKQLPHLLFLIIKPPHDNNNKSPPLNPGKKMSFRSNIIAVITI